MLETDNFDREEKINEFNQGVGLSLAMRFVISGSCALITMVFFAMAGAAYDTKVIYALCILPACGWVCTPAGK